MSKVKGWVLAFAVGGLYAVIGQIIWTAFTGALGADFPYLGQLTLLGMGVVALVLYIPGIHQRIAAVSGFGSILPFNGFAGGVADAYEGAVAETGQASKGVSAAIKLVLLVIGIGGLVDVIVGAIAFCVA